MASAVPSKAIAILIDAIRSGQYLSLEVLDAAVEVGKWVFRTFFANGFHHEGPMALTDGKPLDDEQAVALLQSLDPKEGEPQKFIDPVTLAPLLLFLIRKLGGAFLTRVLLAGR